MACDNSGLTAGILRDCADNNVGGIEVNLLLINSKDINRVATTFHATKRTLVTALTLKAGKTGFLVNGVKQVNALKFELVPKDISDDMFKHTMAIIIPNVSTDNKERLVELSKETVVAVVELKFKGTDSKEAFQMGGYFSGLKLTTATYASNENDGSISVELVTPENYEEPLPILTVLETDYDTTKTAFDNKFATAP